MKRFSKIFLAFLLFPALGWAQNFTISGTVKDTTNNEAVVSALVRLQNPKDTTIVFSGVTDIDGKFSIATNQGKSFVLHIRTLGYKNKSLRVFAENGTNLGVIYVAPDKEVLKEIQVTGVAQRAVQKGDTTQFIADAFKTNPDANAEDLIKKMPGVVVQNGQVTAQGEQVKRVLVDGKPFFGDDPQTALKNLPANAIEKIEVFDRKSDQSKFTGFNDGDDEKTINIITRPAFKNGTFGRAFAGYGTDDRYNAGGNINNFKGNKRFSLVAMSNNINEQNFGNQDLLGVVGTSGNTGRGYGYGRGPSVQSDPNDFAVGSQSGINTTHSIGLNYSDEWKKVKLNASYFFNNSSNVTSQDVTQNYFLTDTTNQIYQSMTRGNSKNFNHRFNLRMEYKINENNSIIFTPNASLQMNSGLNTNYANTTYEGSYLNKSTNQYSSDLSGYNLGGEVLYQLKFAKVGRTFSYSLRGNATDNDGTTNLLAVTSFFNNNVETIDSLLQEGTPANDALKLRSRVRYTEPLGKTGQLEFGYDYTRNTSDNNKETYNYDPDTKLRTTLDTNLSNVFQSLYEANKVGAGYRIRGKKLNGGFGLDYQYATLESDLVFPRSGNIYRPYSNILPNGMLMYQFNKQTNLRIFYRTGTDEPSPTQLQDVVDNSNPLQLRVGNPNLQQAYSNRFFMRFSTTNTETARTFSAFGWVRQTRDYITTATLLARADTVISNGVILKSGSQLSYPVNVNGYVMSGANVTWGLPVAKLKSNLNLSTGANYAHTPGLINNVENVSQTLGITENISLTSNFSDKIDFTIGLNANYNLVKNSLQPNQNNNYYIQTATASLNYIFWKNLVFRTSVNHQWYAGLNDGFNQNFALWNASIGKKFLKDNQAEISLSVFDILNQNQSISRTVTAAYVQDVQTLVLQQYFMLTFTWNIKSFKEG